MADVIQGLSLWLHLKVFRGNIRSTAPVSCDVKAAVKSAAVGVEPSSLYQSCAVTQLPKTSIPDWGYRRTKRLVGFACVTFPKLGNHCTMVWTLHPSGAKMRGLIYLLRKFVTIRSKMAEPLVGNCTTCFKLWLDRSCEISKSLKSPRTTTPQSGYLFLKKSMVLITYSLRLRWSSAGSPGGW